uniref:LIM domain and actin binding 1a n=1 Tax=Salmo trutta TaxID=8032 RepID=A0A674AA25_SALTR
MAIAPFSRRQWASHSLRVTGKELSIVGTRGKNNAIAERFSKYQLAAEEGNSERKKAAADPLPPTLCSGNLSVLKKWWEQPVQSSATSCAPLPHTRCLLPLNPKERCLAVLGGMSVSFFSTTTHCNNLSMSVLP